MTKRVSERLHLTVNPDRRVSAILQLPPRAFALYVIGHGAGAGMQHTFMEEFATALEARAIGTLRYNFPYMEAGSRRPDPPALCQATVRAAVVEAHQRAPHLPLFAGGKSFGGRMTSQAQAAAPLQKVAGLAFVGFPLHPAKRPSTTRAAHLEQVGVPMLFLQGTRDELADMSLLTPLVKKLGPHVTLSPIEAADHGFHVLKRSGRDDSAVINELAETLRHWITSIVDRRDSR